MKTFKTIIALSTFLILTGCTQLLVVALNQVDMTKISVQGNKMYLMGDFNSKSYRTVRQAIDTHPKVKTIVLTASSGSLDDDTTFKLARYIREKGLNTHLINQSVIASGAVDLFLAGKQRSMEKGAKLGVHSWSDGSKEAKDFPRNHSEHKLNASYINDMLGKDDFYWFTIYAASADEIYWMKPAEVQQYGLITTSFLPPSHDQTPFGKAFTEERADILED
jgi:beta-lactamase class D